MKNPNLQSEDGVLELMHELLSTPSREGFLRLCMLVGLLAYSILSSSSHGACGATVTQDDSTTGNYSCGAASELSRSNRHGNGVHGIPCHALGVTPTLVICKNVELI